MSSYLSVSHLLRGLIDRERCNMRNFVQTSLPDNEILTPIGRYILVELETINIKDGAEAVGNLRTVCTEENDVEQVSL